MMYVRSMSERKKQKKIDGEWHQVDVFEFPEDNIQAGHGEKSVYDSSHSCV